LETAGVPDLQLCHAGVIEHGLKTFVSNGRCAAPIKTVRLDDARAHPDKDNLN
jgi:hypothetical protein